MVWADGFQIPVLRQALSVACNIQPTKPIKELKLDKYIWTDVDFDEMQWHDNPIHAITFGDNFEILLDIDYIFEWVLKENIYNYWISPCTLIFENVYNLTFEVGPTAPGFTIDFISKSNPKRPKNSEYINRDTEFDWSIEMQEGTIAFTSVGFKQFVRQSPRFVQKQKLALTERGGLSFDPTRVE